MIVNNCKNIFESKVKRGWLFDKRRIWVYQPFRMNGNPKVYESAF